MTLQKTDWRGQHLLRPGQEGKKKKRQEKQSLSGRGVVAAAAFGRCGGGGCCCCCCSSSCCNNNCSTMIRSRNTNATPLSCQPGIFWPWFSSYPVKFGSLGYTVSVLRLKLKQEIFVSVILLLVQIKNNGKSSQFIILFFYI